MATRYFAQLRYDIRRGLKGKSALFLRRFVGRSALRVLVADDWLVKQGEKSTLSPGLKAALEQLKHLARSEK